MLSYSSSPRRSGVAEPSPPQPPLLDADRSERRCDDGATDVRYTDDTNGGSREETCRE